MVSIEMLNDNQKQAVLTDSRYVRIIAGAGSGKTRVLTMRIAKMCIRDSDGAGGIGRGGGLSGRNHAGLCRWFAKRARLLCVIIKTPRILSVRQGICGVFTWSVGQIQRVVFVVGQAGLVDLGSQLDAEIAVMP